jgi:hypothetical protein
MQDNFLFNDNDKRQRGHNCDALCSKDSRLKFKWNWYYVKNGKHLPCQKSIAYLKNGWSLEVLFWHTEYSAEVRKNGNDVDNYNIRYDETTKKMPALLNRLDAQLKSEELYEKIGIHIIKQSQHVNLQYRKPK